MKGTGLRGNVECKGKGQKDDSVLLPPYQLMHVQSAQRRPAYSHPPPPNSTAPPVDLSSSAAGARCAMVLLYMRMRAEVDGEWRSTYLGWWGRGSGG